MENDLMEIEKKNDLFVQREQLIDELIEFNNIEKNRICSLVGEWGSGKSFFIDKFIERVKQEDILKTSEEESEPMTKQSFKIMKFDAWENQASTNINGIFLEFVYNDLIKPLKDGKSFYEFIQEYGLKYFKDLIKSVGEALLPLTKDVSKQMIKPIDEFNNMAVYKMLSNTILNEIIDEKKFYEIMIDLLFSEEQINNKYLLIIDELDRCEPRFSIELIKKIIYLNKEIMKKGKDVNFLISINKLEFANLLNGYYGNEYDTHQYFDKVFDYEFYLPEAQNKYEYLGTLLTKQISLEYELNTKISLKSKENFESLNYRKLNILAEKIENKRPIQWKNQDYMNGFDPAYYFDITRFIIEVIKLKNFKEYLEIKSTILRLRKYNNFFIVKGEARITFKKAIKQKDAFIKDISKVSEYFKKEDLNEIGIISNGYLTQSEEDQLFTLISPEILCLMMDCPI